MAKVAKGSTGAFVLERSVGTGGGGGLLDGKTPKETSVSLFWPSVVMVEPEDKLGGFPSRSGKQVASGFPLTPKSSSSSKVTHPFGLPAFLVDVPCM